jgi:hypothetical protein
MGAIGRLQPFTSLKFTSYQRLLSSEYRLLTQAEAQ